MAQGIYLFDKKEELLDIIHPNEIIEHVQTQELKGLVSCFVNVAYKKKIEEARYIGHFDIDNPKVFQLYHIDLPRVLDDRIELSCTHAFFNDLQASEPIRDKRPQGASAGAVANIILANTRWQLGAVRTNKTASTNFYYLSPLEAFWNFIEKWGIEFSFSYTLEHNKITGRYLHLHDRLSSDYGKRYEYTDKLITVVKETSREQIYTAFLGRGKGEQKINTETNEATGGYGRKIDFSEVVWSKAKGDPLNKSLGDDYIEFPEATAEYGYPDGRPRIQIVEFSDIEDPNELIKATYEYGTNEIRPKLQLKANVVDKNVVELGETVTVVRDDRNIRYKTRVFKLVRDFLQEGKKEFEFGDKLIISSVKQTKNIIKDIKKQENNTIDAVSALLGAIEASYFNEDGYGYDLKANNNYNLPGGYYSFNRPIDQNPTKVIYIGAGKMMIADEKDPNGLWKWKTAATGSGLVADVVNTGTLNANLVKAGTISDKLGKFFMNMETGAFNFADKLIFDPTTNNLTITLVDDLAKDMQSKLDVKAKEINLAVAGKVGYDEVKASVNASEEGVRIYGRNLILDGFTQVNGDFKVSGSALFGTISGRTLDFEDIQAESITTGTIRVNSAGTHSGTLDNSSAYFGGVYKSASITGSQTGINADSDAFTFDYYQNRLLVHGRIDSEPRGTNNHHSFELNGMSLYANGHSFSIKPWSGSVLFSHSYPIQMGALECSSLKVNGKTITG